MRALILAAGRGSRFGEDTAERPKCMMEIAGKSILQWQLDAFKACGIHQIAFATGHCSEHLSNLGYTCFHNSDWAVTNMVASLTKCDAWLQSGTTLVAYSDIVFHPAILKSIIAIPGPFIVSYDTSWQSLWELRFENPYLDAESFVLDSNGRLKSIGKRHPSPGEVQGQYMGLMKLEPAGWELLKHTIQENPDPNLDMTTLLNRHLNSGHKIDLCPISGNWVECDQMSDIEAYEKALKSEWDHDWRWESK